MLKDKFIPIAAVLIIFLLLINAGVLLQVFQHQQTQEAWLADLSETFSQMVLYQQQQDKSTEYLENSLSVMEGKLIHQTTLINELSQEINDLKDDNELLKKKLQ